MKSSKPSCILCGCELEFIRYLVGIWNHWICLNCNTQQRVRLGK